MNKPFSDIAKQLNTIAETHFDLPERSKGMTNEEKIMKFGQLLSNIDASNSCEVLEETGDLKQTTGII